MSFNYFSKLPLEIRTRIWVLAVGGAKIATEIYLLHLGDDDADSDYTLPNAEPLELLELGYGMLTCPAVFACQESLDVWLRLGAILPTPLASPPPANTNWQRLSLVCLAEEMHCFNGAPLSTMIQNLVIENFAIRVAPHLDPALSRVCSVTRLFPALRTFTGLTYHDVRLYNDEHFFSSDCWLVMHFLHYGGEQRQFTVTFGHEDVDEELWLTAENYSRRRYWGDSLAVEAAQYGRLIEFMTPVVSLGRWLARGEEDRAPVDIREAILIDEVSDEEEEEEG